MEGALGAVGVLGAIILFVVAHEAGHFVAAKATGMKVTEFFLGFGPRIWSFRRGETEYGVKPIPFGAYVRIVGMTWAEDVEPADAGRTYREKEFWKKSVVVLAGVAANFLLAYLLFLGLVLWAGATIPTREVSGLVELEDGTESAAAAAGVRPGDVIVGFDGAPVLDWDDLAAAVMTRPGDEVVLEVRRGGEELELAAVIGSRKDASGETIGFLGIAPATERQPIGVFSAAGLAGEQVWVQVKMTFSIFSQILRFDTFTQLIGGIGGGEVDPERRPISVVGMAQIGAQAGDIGFANLVYLLAAVNVVLGTINALPLFPLDGGHFAVALIERITKRRVDVRALIPVAVLVIGVLGILGVTSIILDIVQPLDIPS
jgi:membrane-associated protease RseP (regulator of RpoE activity)